MTFETTIATDGTRLCFVDGYAICGQVYDTLRPSKLFPVDTGMSPAEALAEVERIMAAAPKPPPHKGPYFALAINDAHPLRSDALAIHSSQRAAIMARNAKHGINVRYDKLGRPVFTDRGQRKALMRLEKVRSMNSFDGY